MKLTEKRIASLLLAALMMAGTIISAVSCADTGDSGKESGTSISTTETADESNAETEEVTVPAYDTVEKTKFGREFVYLTREFLLPDMYVEKVTGDLLDDSIFERNTQVCEDFDIEMVYVTVEGQGDLVASRLQMQVNGQLDEYDAYFGNKLAFNTCVTNNYCYNLSNVATLGLNQPWWDQGCYGNLSVSGKTYVLNGDINPYSMIMTSCMIFNKDLMRDLSKSVTDLNTKAKNGEWTLDLLLEYTANVTNDLNGDGNIDIDNDRFGITCWYMDAPYSTFYGAGGLFVENVDGIPELTYTAEGVTNIYEKLFTLFVDQKANYVTDLADYSKAYSTFNDNRALFAEVTLGKIETTVDGMKQAYGILPIPKYDTNQEDYLSFINGATTLIMLAKTESDPEFAGTILEALATYNYDNVTPNLFEVVTKLQTAQDPESAAMVDVILRNRVYDIGYFCDFEITNLVRDKLAAGESSIASSLASLENTTKGALARLIRSFDRCE